jgi:hypothetical protein
MTQSRPPQRPVYKAQRAALVNFASILMRVNQTVGGQFTPLGAHSASLQLQKSWSTRQVS